MTALKEFFNFFDVNEDGFISQEELYKTLKCLGFALTFDDTQFIIDELDDDGEEEVVKTFFKNNEILEEKLVKVKTCIIYPRLSCLFKLSNQKYLVS